MRQKILQIFKVRTIAFKILRSTFCDKTIQARKRSIFLVRFEIFSRIFSSTKNFFYYFIVLRCSAKLGHKCDIICNHIISQDKIESSETRNMCIECGKNCPAFSITKKTPVYLKKIKNILMIGIFSNKGIHFGKTIRIIYYKIWILFEKLQTLGQRSKAQKCFFISLVLYSQSRENKIPLLRIQTKRVM